MLTLFFSYSHQDEAARNELEIHLAMLKRQGTISVWHDRRIGAGRDIDQSISEKLDDADIILLLVSPHFLASDYCYDAEMQRALHRHLAGQARVIPVILEPCDWREAPFGRLRATPPDGRPVAKYPNTNEAYLAVIQDIRAAAMELLQGRSATPRRGEPEGPTPTRPVVTAQQRSSNLRVRRTFTDRDKDDHLEGLFHYVEVFFENSLDELARRNPGTETRFHRIDGTHFEAAIYDAGRTAVQCRVWLSPRRVGLWGLAYSTNPSPSDSSYNELLSVDDDGYALGFRPTLQGFRGVESKDLLTYEGTAEHIWGLFVGSIQ